jgi:hypothetical protein
LKINGIVNKYTGPLVQALVQIEELGITNQLTWFLFDTGATYTQLSERDWSTRFHIDPTILEKREKEPTLTAGGEMPSWILPKRTKLLFRSTSSDIHIEDLPSIRVINYEGFPEDERKKLESVLAFWDVTLSSSSKRLSPTRNWKWKSSSHRQRTFSQRIRNSSKSSPALYEFR